MPFDATPRKVNETSEGLRRMAAWFRANGYTPSESQCFVTCAHQVSDGSTTRRRNLWTPIVFGALAYNSHPIADFTDFLIASGYPADPTGEKAAQLCERVAAELEVV